MRIRINFSKTEVIKYTSHLDLYRAWERTLRRAELPLAYSKGFKPHAHINLAAALPLGFTSENDLVDIWLEKDLSIEVIAESLNQSVPPGLVIKSVTDIPQQTPTLQKLLIASEYIVTVLDEKVGLSEKITEILKSETLWRERNGKEYDLRPLILNLELSVDNVHSHQQIMMSLQTQPGATGRPEEVLLSLDVDPARTIIHRKRLLMNEPE